MHEPPRSEFESSRSSFATLFYFSIARSSWLGFEHCRCHKFEMATDLFCCERLQPDLRKTEKDPVIFNDARVINNLLCLEKQYIPPCDYFSDVQKDIKPFMRKIVTTWMLEVCEELGVEEQVFPLAVNYLDRFLCNCCINKRHLQLAASVCIMLASKIRQCQYVSIETLCFYADHSITSQEMKDWELLILSKLQWNVAAVTGFDFIDHIIDRVPWGMEHPLIRRHASTLVGICYTEPDFILIPPSVIATACICSAVRGLKIQSADLALQTVCQLLNLPGSEEVELVIKRIEAAFQAEAAAFQQSNASSKMAGVQMSPTANKQEDTVDGHPETPTDIQDVHF